MALIFTQIAVSVTDIGALIIKVGRPTTDCLHIEIGVSHATLSRLWELDGCTDYLIVSEKLVEYPTLQKILSNKF